LDRDECRMDDINRIFDGKLDGCASFNDVSHVVVPRLAAAALSPASLPPPRP
jgi:hypothetical protein